MSATVSIRLGRVLGEVPAAIYGQFTEHLVNIVYDGLWSEKLFGRTFETPMVSRARHEIAAPWEPFAGRLDQWTSYPRGPYPLPRYASPHRHAHHSQAVAAAPGNDGAERGLAQRDVVVDAGVPYRFRARVRRTGPAGVLRVALRTGDGARVLTEARVEVPPVGDTRFGPNPDLRHLWMDDLSFAEIAADLEAGESDPAGMLTLTFDPAVDAACVWWFDWVSLMPADNAGGWHSRVVEELRALPVSLLKWPGGCMADAYDWRGGIGPRDARFGTAETVWAAWDENDVGIDEFVDLCRRTGAEPVIGVNAGDGTPELAAAWVEYCNGSAATEWGAMRAQNGHPEPYAIRTWVVGNEQWGFFERGHVGAEAYARRYLAFADAMRKVDPTITLVAVGQPGDFNRTVLRAAAAHIDMLQIHFYTPEGEEVTDHESATRKIASASAFDDLFAQVRNDIASVPGAGHVRVCLDEWGWSQAGHAGALFLAGALNAMHRAAPLVAIGARAAVINVDGLLDRQGDVVRRTPAYEIFRLYGLCHRPLAIETTIDGDVAGAIDASCLSDADGRAMTLYVINRSTQPVPMTVDLARDITRVTTYELTADGQDPAGPSRLRTTPSGPQEPHLLAPLSLTLFEIR